MRRRYSRLLYIAVLAGAAVAIGSGVALGVVGADGSINGCYKAENGQLRVIDATGACNRAELPISWNQTGPQGPAGPAGPAGPEGPKGDQGPPGETVRGYRVSRLTPSEVEVTAVGGGPIGFTFPAGSGPTQILTMTLPKGVYAVNSSVAARKDFGTGDFICWVHNNVTAQNVTRTALGAEVTPAAPPSPATASSASRLAAARSRSSAGRHETALASRQASRRPPSTTRSRRRPSRAQR